MDEIPEVVRVFKHLADFVNFNQFSAYHNDLGTSFTLFCTLNKKFDKTH